MNVNSGDLKTIAGELATELFEVLKFNHIVKENLPQSEIDSIYKSWEKKIVKAFIDFDSKRQTEVFARISEVLK